MGPSLARLMLLLALVLPGTALTPPARADETSEARRDFRAAQRNADWKERRAAYVNLLDYDSAKVFEELLSALMREQHPGVLVEGIKALGRLESDDGRGALSDALRKAKGRKAHYLLLAVAEQRGGGGEDLLIEILRGKDVQMAALAAVALGAKATQPVVAPLAEALEHKAWQVAGAAARALRHIAWSAWAEPKQKGMPKTKAKPTWFDPKDVLWPLVDALEVWKGSARGDVIEALEAITKKDYGDNLEAWIQVAKGEEPSEAVLAKRVRPAYFFGLPIYGKRIVIVHDVNVRTEDLHPFEDRARLRELCKVPGARDVPWYNLVGAPTRNFIAAHTRRTIQDLPTRGVQFELILSGLKPKSAFGKLKGSNPGTKKSAHTLLEKLKVTNGNDILTAMNQALDISGSKDSVAMSRGPDHVLCVYASVPWLAEETDAEVVGTAIGLKARLRSIPITAVGVREHAYGMLGTFAQMSGGRYLDLSK